MQHILYDEWGFDGYSVSDAGAVGDVGPNKNLMWDQVRGHFYGKSMAEACALSLNGGLISAPEMNISCIFRRLLIRALPMRMRWTEP
jgi:hypothetical protein